MKSRIKRERWTIHGKKKSRIVARDSHGRFKTHARPSKTLTVKRIKAGIRERALIKVVRIWVKISYKSKRSGHDFYLEGYIQRHIEWSKRHTILGELVMVVNEMFGENIAEMCEYGVENLEFQPQDNKRMEKEEWQGEARTSAAIETNTGEAHGLIRTIFSTIRLRWENGYWTQD